MAAAEQTIERLIHVDSTNAKPYMIRGWAHMYRRNHDAAIADHQRALQLNPNFAPNLFAMAWSEAIAGMGEAAKEHAELALRLSPRETDLWLGEGYGAIAIASFHEGDFAAALRWGQLAGQRQPVVQALLAAANAHLGEEAPAHSHIAALRDFAPDFLNGVLSGEIEVFKLAEHNERLVAGLRTAAGE